MRTPGLANRLRVPVCGASTSKENTPMKTVGRIGAALAFAFCLLGGLWILSRANFTSKDDILATAIGFYFGKGILRGADALVGDGKVLRNGTSDP